MRATDVVRQVLDLLDEIDGPHDIEDGVEAEVYVHQKNDSDSRFKHILAMRNFNESLRETGLLNSGPPKLSTQNNQKFSNQLDKSLSSILPPALKQEGKKFLSIISLFNILI